MAESQFTDNDRFRFARGQEGVFVDVADIDPADRYALGSFSCISCGSTMVAALPQRRRRYFRHKGGRPAVCSRESYLHAAAKHAIANSISEAIREGQPFYISSLGPIICDQYFSAFGILCEHQSKLSRYDLARQFDQVDVEAQVGVFSADVLLRSTRNSNAELLIEIAVTHPCSAEKLSSGMRILELEIKSDVDIANFQKGIDLRADNVRDYNLKPPKPRHSKCSSACSWIAKAFFIDDDGKASIEVFDVSHLASIARSPKTKFSRYIGSANHYRERTNWQTFIEECKHAVSIEKIELRSCAICMHARPSLTGRPVICALLGKSGWPTDAIDCCDFSSVVDD